MTNKEEVRQQKLVDAERLARAEADLADMVSRSADALERAIIEITALGKRTNVPLQEARQAFIRAHNDVMSSPSSFAIDTAHRKVEAFRQKAEEHGA